MTSTGTEDKEKLRKDKAKRAIALAMQNHWSEAVETNLSILRVFPEDLEAYNRLGKALTELGRNREAKAAFQRALQISPHNPIAKKNLGRLTQLGDEASPSNVASNTAPHMFIEESGKTGITSLINLTSPKMLLKLAPGHPVDLRMEDGGLKVSDQSGEYIGQVEPKLASRLIRLMKGGNRYEATITSVGGQELTIMIREVFKHPSQADIVSFPSRGGADYHVYLPSTILGYDLGDEDSEETGPIAIKDWSDDDTEPGDDDAFSPVLHRIISTRDEESSVEEEL